jgi:hypothetical protein
MATDLPLFPPFITYHNLSMALNSSLDTTPCLPIPYITGNYTASMMELSRIYNVNFEPLSEPGSGFTTAVSEAKRPLLNRFGSEAVKNLDSSGYMYGWVGPIWPKKSNRRNHAHRNRLQILY